MYTDARVGAARDPKVAYGRSQIAARASDQAGAVALGGRLVL